MELQLALLLIGVFIVGAVVLSAYDRARIRSRVSQTPPPASAVEEPVPTPPPRSLDVNPAPPVRDSKVLSSDAQTPPVPEKSPGHEFYQEIQALEDVAIMPLPRAVLPTSARRGPVSAMPDPQIDFVITLPGPGPVARDEALSVYKQNEYMLEKPHNIYGLRMGAGIWTDLERDGPATEYSHISLAIQMYDAKGTITESELNTFAQLGLKLADSLQRPTKLSMTFEQAMTAADDLANLCETYDVIASVNLLPVSPNGFPGRAVESAAARFGMEFGARNIFHLKNNHTSGCRHLFSMANLYEPGEFDLARLEHTAIEGLTLFMHVPSANQPVKVFEKMVDTARHLGDVLGGTLVDQEHRPLTSNGVGVIQAQIAAIEANLQNVGIVPGSATALRLFDTT